MIEARPGILNETENPTITKVVEEEEHKEQVIASVTLPKYGTVNTDYKAKTIKSLEVTDIYNDNGDFIIEVPSNEIGIDAVQIRVPRDLMKKVIYDIYLT